MNHGRIVLVAGAGKLTAAITHILANQHDATLLVVASDEDEARKDLALPEPIQIKNYHELTTINHERPFFPKMNHKRKFAGPYNKPQRRKKR